MSRKDSAALRAALKAATDSLKPLIDEANAEESRHSSAIGSIFVRIALALHTGAAVKVTLGQDWRVWAASSLKALTRPVSPPTLYRLRNAGAVAEILGAAVGEASYTALVPLYRLLADAAGKSDEIVKAATESVSDIWAAAVEAAAPMSPTEEAVRQLVEIEVPTTRGAKGRTAKGRKAATAKAKRSRNTPTDTGENDGAGNVETVSIDPAAVEACGKIAGSMVGAFVKAGTDEGTVRGIMLAAVRLIREHGADTVAAALAAPAGK